MQKSIPESRWQRARRFFADPGFWFNLGHIPLQTLVYTANLWAILPAAGITLASKAYGVFWPNHKPKTAAGQFFKDPNFGFIPLAFAQTGIARRRNWPLG